MPKLVRVLSIDGGGVRGIIPLRVLAELERLTGRRTADIFDIVTGTSTGGIIALSLSRGPLPGMPVITAAELLEVYCRQTPVIFPKVDPHEVRAWWDPEARSVFSQRFGAALLPHHYGNARYHPAGLEQVLHSVFGDARLDQATTAVVVPAYDMVSGKPVLFRSCDAQDGSSLNPPMVEVARATSAAPTYFPPLRRTEGDREVVLVDGGVVANSPVAIGYFEALSTGVVDGVEPHVQVVSLGTGRPPADVPTYEEIWSRGWPTLVMGLLGVVFNGTTQLAHDRVEWMVRRSGPPSGLWRFDPELRDVSLHFDDASPATIARLLECAEDLVTAAKDDLGRFCESFEGTA